MPHIAPLPRHLFASMASGARRPLDWGSCSRGSPPVFCATTTTRVTNLQLPLPPRGCSREQGLCRLPGGSDQQTRQAGHMQEPRRRHVVGQGGLGQPRSPRCQPPVASASPSALLLRSTSHFSSGLGLWDTSGTWGGALPSGQSLLLGTLWISRRSFSVS